MSLWILDTDGVSLFLEGNTQIGERAASKFPNVAITIIKKSIDKNHITRVAQ